MHICTCFGVYFRLSQIYFLVSKDLKRIWRASKQNFGYIYHFSHFIFTVLGFSSINPNFSVESLFDKASGQIKCEPSFITQMTYHFRNMLINCS